MKLVLVTLFSATMLLALTPAQTEAVLSLKIDISHQNDTDIENRTAELEAKLQKRAQERAEKEKAREAKLKALDAELQKKAQERNK